MVGRTSVRAKRGLIPNGVMREHLAQFLAETRTEGVVFIGRAQEKVSVRATTRRKGAAGRARRRSQRPLSGEPMGSKAPPHQ